MNPAMTNNVTLHWLSNDRTKHDAGFWKQYLTGIPEMIQLPLDSPRPSEDGYRPGYHTLSLDPDLRSRLTATTSSNERDLTRTLLSAFVALLSRYSLQDDLVVGWFDEGADQQIPLPVRFTLAHTDTFNDLLIQTGRQLELVTGKPPVKPEDIADELMMATGHNIHPIFQVLFERTVLPVGRSVPPTPVDLWISVHENTEQPGILLGYNTALFRPETIERMAGHYVRMLSSVADDRSMLLQRIPVLTDKEYTRIIRDWNSTRIPYPKDKCVHHIFEEQAAKTPDAIAVEDDHTQLTYAALNKKANRLAHRLMADGAGVDTVITLFIGRSVDILVSLLAVSKTGATYLPLDPIYPKARLALILEDAKPLIHITERPLLDKLPDTGAKAVLLDEEPLDDETASGNLSFGNAMKPVYILYTSGSTGKPKGVPILQRSLVNLICSFSNMMRIHPQDIYLSVATIAFDIAELDMYLPLFNGARVVIASQETVIDMELLKQRFETSHATLFQATPVTYKMLLLNHWKGKSDLRVITGGDALSKDQGRKLLAVCKEVWNCYGPTETTIYSTGSRVMPEDVTGEGIVNIGRPLDNNFMYVVNAAQVPVPAGIPGELCIGGDSVSPGYLNLPELNAERFLPDPFSGDANAMMYRSGDLVKYLQDGRLVFLNRIDSQVKIRGFRIELGEIETVLAGCPGVLENVVMIRKDPAGDNMLAAYYRAADDMTAGHRELRQYLSGKLPDYMVPSAFIRMERFPLTANNKIDKKALPEPEPVIPDKDLRQEDTLSGTERRLAEIWRLLLKLDTVSSNDDFFEAGGHSLTAVNLILRIEQEFGHRLSMTTLFDLPTLHLQAEHLDQILLK
jgi:amino acid adenylation domain-containing protein